MGCLAESHFFLGQPGAVAGWADDRAGLFGNPVLEVPGAKAGGRPGRRDGVGQCCGLAVAYRTMGDLVAAVEEYSILRTLDEPLAKQLFA
ncbi:MAG: hypothetical protein WC600_18875 [Desulfobaccales bacterium]